MKNSISIIDLYNIWTIRQIQGHIKKSKLGRGLERKRHIQVLTGIKNRLVKQAIAKTEAAK